MHLIAHRGLARSVPENTLAAFAAALSTGFEGIETDLRLSADGEVVLFHDRISPLGEPISSLTRTALSQSVGYLVPTLAEALDAFPDTYWNLEIKAPEALDQALALVAHRGIQQRVLVTSFHHEVVVQAAERLDADCGFLLHMRPPALNTILYPALPCPRLRTLVWHFEMLDPHLLTQANALGFRNYVYGAMTDYEHMLCHELGVHGIITDYPEFVGLKPCPALQ
ncbi:glycerophosphoryl diester phosphodiesterase [Andreprevotia lacus DSM 23236]|jgi:glycerophosphoryl diester phosphodiesterase|uniref:Glycerophosphoryl diester phosphodiesterase n=1 Tax=Andreprevotia lacus DSM 23236 TaxID=1121001 RepID=A0A1W1XIP8_9NEIS|nr:glycerophosphodiester phosphodiesterase [Andreprevotia lacus]SMC23391.1 glycerophosphoryl diester phosphodiesterase [Andreprevotia lacus DSM 23236]